MAIYDIAVDALNKRSHRKVMQQKGFCSGYYFSFNGFDVKKMRQLAEQGKMNAVRCHINNSVTWYYAEDQAERFHLQGIV